MNFQEFCINQHDVVCNQKYNKTLPYSFHLEMVYKQFEKFSHIFKDDFIPKNPNNRNTYDIDVNIILADACYGHDLIEDARMTFNDIKQMDVYDNFNANEILANIIYCCTDEKGKDRAERHNDKFYNELKGNKYAVFVKLCDMIANVTFSLLLNSSMYRKYQKEFPHFYKMVNDGSELEELDPMFEYLETLLEVQ